jgi:hypothetical protein
MATIGESGPSANTINYDALLSSTLMAYRTALVDNVFKSNAWLAALKEFGGIDYQDGGERIQIPLMYGENDTFKSYSGYTTLTVKPQEGITSAFYPWCEIGGTISISRREERQNSGEARILNLLKSKIMQAEMTIKGKVNQQLIQGTQNGSAGSQTFVPGNDALDLFPLGYFCPKANATDPAAGGNIGNISSASYSWWRAKTAVLNNTTKDTGNSFALSITTWKGMIAALKRMYNFCSRGADGSGPTIVLGTQAMYECYESAVDERSRLQTTKLGQIGFDSIKLKGAEMVWDELVPNIDEGYLPSDANFETNNVAGTAFFVNTAFYKLVIDRETDFVTTPFVEPENQTAKTAKVLFMGNATCSNLAKQGVVYGASHTIAS